MPTYEYECRECGHRFEELQNMSDAPIETCPECKGRVDKLMTAGGVIVKGGGAEFRPECGQGRACPGCEVARDTPPCAR